MIKYQYTVTLEIENPIKDQYEFTYIGTLTDLEKFFDSCNGIHITEIKFIKKCEV